jgi:arylsulfatase
MATPLPPRCNVLLITSDQHRFDAVGCNGNPRVRTPHLDRLAREGANLAGHTTSNPLCTPARASILTGRYARSHGAWTVGATLPPETQGLSHALGAAGYHCALTGKAHFEPECSNYVERLDPARAYYGFHETHITEDNQIGEYLDWIRREHPQHLAAILENNHEGLHQPSRMGQVSGRIAGCYASAAPEHLHQTAWIVDRSLEVMARARADGKPWFVWCSFVDPHHPWTPPEPYASSYDPASLPPPRRRPGEHEGTGDSGFHLDGLADGEYRRMCAMYYAMISHLDAHVGRMLADLDRRGELERTIILFTSDHGDYNGDHGYIRKGSTLYDSLLKVPMLVRLPDGACAGRRIEALTQHEDLAPTILDLLGLPAMEDAQGVSIAPAVLAGQGFPRARAFHEYRGWIPRDGTYGARRGDWKLLRYPDRRGWVLVDLRSDPDEYDNRWNHPVAAAIQAELKDDLLHWLADTPRHCLPRAGFW